MKLVGVGTAAVNQLLFPVVAIVISFFLLGEILNSSEGVGIALILGGILIAQLSAK